MALSERLAIIITANGAGAVSEFKSIERSATRDLGKAETAGQKFKANWTRIGAGMLVVGAAIAAGLRTALDEASQAAVVGRQTEAVIRSTGGAANVTKSHLEDLAGSLSKVAAVDDEVIQSAGNVLLTFKNVANQVGEGNDIFDRAVESALDMSAALGTDLQGATLQLGKALANPLSGLTALRRAGVDFTAQQMDQIKAMVAVGDTLGAQRAIMDEVESQFDGQAEAGATALDKLSVGWGNLMETIGRPIEDSGIIDWWAANWEDPMTRLGAAWDEVERGLTGAPIKIEFDGETISRMAQELGIGKQALDEFGKGADDASAAVEELTDEISDYLSQTFDVSEAQRQLGESGNTLREAMASWEPNWNTQAEAMQGFVTDTSEVIASQSKHGASQQALDNTVRGSIQTLRAMRDTGVLTGAQFVTLRDQIIAIPHGTETQVRTPGAREADTQVRNLYAGLKVTGSAHATPRVSVVTERVQFDRLVRDLDAADGRRFAMQVSVNTVGSPMGLPKRAAGGPVEAGMPYIVGDGGRPELFVPNQSGTILPSVPTGGGGGGGGCQHDIILDGEKVGEIIDRRNRRFNMARAEA